MDLKLACARCGAEFIVNTANLRSVGLSFLPKRCPSCCDEIQGRPEEAQIVTRAMLMEWDGVRIAVPNALFNSFTADASLGDRPGLRAIISGKMGRGVSWSGRMDIYDFRHDASLPGRARLMRAQHRKGSLIEEGSPERYRDTYEYLAIDPTDAVETSTLVLARVDFKTTLKGLGRQIHATLDASSAIWSYRMESACRTGRFGSHMALAIVDETHPVVGRLSGDEDMDLVWNGRLVGERDTLLAEPVETLADVWPDWYR